MLAGAVGGAVAPAIRRQHHGHDRARPRYQPVRPARLAAGGRAVDGGRYWNRRVISAASPSCSSISAALPRGASTRSPQEVVDRLDGAFAVLVDILDRHGGIVNKFLGDGFLALFGAPLEAHDAAHQAVAAAREMLEATIANKATKLAAADRHRHSLRRSGRRQYRLAAAQGIYRDRRYRELCRAARSAQQGFQFAIPDLASGSRRTW